MNVDNLPSKLYTINVEKDTVIQTEKGALLKIPKGALKPEKGNSATLEIKEAYSMADMIKAGLVTESDGKPLSSGGMIYLNYPKGAGVSFSQPIKIAIPANYLQSGMQLYDGEEKDGEINWTKPTALAENKQLSATDSGRILFQAQCANCHAIGKTISAPDLANLTKRKNFYSEDGFPRYHWPREKPKPNVSIYDGTDTSYDYMYLDYEYIDPCLIYECNLRKLFVGVGPPQKLTENEYRNLLLYIENESERLKLPMPAHAYLDDCVDSCYEYKLEVKHLESLKQLTTEEREKLIEENKALVNVNPDTTWPVGQTVEITTEINKPIVYDEKVSPKNYDAVYYQFDVSSFGWKNIDMMLDEVPGLEESELVVKITGEIKEKIGTFLIIPSVKTYAQGGPAERNSEEFAFDKKNGKIPLPQNVDAYILAITETDSSIAFGLKKFTTSTKQEIEVSLHASTKDEFMKAMEEFDKDRLHLKVEDTKNANEIKKQDVQINKINEQLKEVEKLRPRQCDCDCQRSKIDSVTKTVNDYVSSTFEETPTAFSVKVFPNPSANYFTIRTSSTNQNDNISLFCYDVNGRIIETKYNLNSNQTITIGQNYRPGSYFLAVKQGRIQKTIELIKQ
jgi:hypothetical protein